VAKSSQSVVVQGIECKPTERWAHHIESLINIPRKVSTRGGAAPQSMGGRLLAGPALRQDPPRSSHGWPPLQHAAACSVRSAMAPPSDGAPDTAASAAGVFLAGAETLPFNFLGFVFRPIR
jgi:hypothetical protein